MNELIVAAEQEIGKRFVRELPVEVELRVLLRGDLKIQRAANVLGAERELMASGDYAEVVGELERSGVDVGQRAGAAERTEFIAEVDLGEIAGGGSDFESDVGRRRQAATRNRSNNS